MVASLSRIMVQSRIRGRIGVRRPGSGGEKPFLETRRRDSGYPHATHESGSMRASRSRRKARHIPVILMSRAGPMRFDDANQSIFRQACRENAKSRIMLKPLDLDRVIRIVRGESSAEKRQTALCTANPLCWIAPARRHRAAVLIVDDDTELVSSLGRILKLHDWDVESGKHSGRGLGAR